jgi:hypothetical protein
MASFGEIVGWCSSGAPGDDKLCLAYVSAALQLMRQPDPVSNGGKQICVPESDIEKKVVPLLVSWGKQHPEAKTQSGGAGIAEALNGRYSCN